MKPEAYVPESAPLLHRIEAMTKGLTLGSLTAADFVRYADGAPGAFAALARAVWDLYDQKEALRSKASGADSLESELEQEAIAAAGLRVEVEELRRQLDDAKLALAKSQKETAWLHDRLTKTKELFDAYQKGGSDGTLP
jgi:regulator of replication initiation timing